MAGSTGRGRVRVALLATASSDETVGIHRLLMRWGGGGGGEEEEEEEGEGAAPSSCRLETIKQVGTWGFANAL